SPQAVKAGITALLIRGERGDLDGVVSGVRSLLARAAGTTPPDHPERLIAITDAAVYLIDHARAADAGPWVDEVVAARRALPGGDNLLLATALLLQADCRLAAGRPGDAEIAAREALAIREKRLPPTHWGRHVAASTLGGCLAGRGRFADAEPLLTQSYQALRENADVPFLRAREAHARVLKMYTDWGRPSEAAKWGDPPLER
ncbi:MAG TPA: tetratricopeptide repeat protein, partial [Urbifossiella sp.]|nr:tetratricopeptide repeat protein [Urbifossiella sp.]